jgi:acetyl esterase/lipase
MADPQWLPDYVEQLPDVVYTAGDGPPLKLDLFRSRDARAGEPRPLVVWLHGGGWMSGDKQRGVERLFPLIRNGFHGASIDYRLSTEALFPAQIHDCKCAVRFLRRHAAEYGFDPARIGVWGASAGGHLASLLAVTAGQGSLEGDRGWPETSSEIQAACSWYGPTDLNLMAQFPRGVTPNSPPLTADSPEGRLVGGAVADRQELVAMADPLRYVHPGAPPLLLMHGSRDNYVPLACSERFHAALLSRSVPAFLHVVKNGHHNAYLWGDHHVQLVSEFFEWHLRAPRDT